LLDAYASAQPPPDVGQPTQLAAPNRVSGGKEVAVVHDGIVMAQNV
jgi:hypothetical protein